MVIQVDPRVVLYTEDMEPTTVLELPGHARAFLSEQGTVTVAVMEPFSILDDEVLAYARPKTVTIRAERFVYKGQKHLMLFTTDEENAMLLCAAFLPGQRRDLNEQRAKAFANGFLTALFDLGR